MCASSQIQQYYELIGKYDQYVAGWDDLNLVRRDGTYRQCRRDGLKLIRSKTSTPSGGSATKIERDDSNRFLKRASTISGVILINHVISAIDAARVARARTAGADEAALRGRTRFALVMQPWTRGRVPMLVAYKPLDW